MSDNPFAARVEPISPDDNSVTARLARLELWRESVERWMAEHPPVRLALPAPDQEVA